MVNKYVDFVSDEDFLECIKWVCDSYPLNSEIDMEHLQRNTLDPIKQVFDISAMKIDSESWIKNELIRQQDKTINNRIGDFHQRLLGKVEGWEDLGTGDSTKVDLRKTDNSVFMELKNKENTVNADSKDQVRRKLAKILEIHPTAQTYWAYILSTRGDSGESTWKYHEEDNPKIKRIWGKNVYELVTGKSDALEQVWKAIPLAVADVMTTDFKLSSSELKKLKEFFVEAFQ